MSVRFTSLAEGMFQVREFLQKLEELSGKVTYERDPVISQKSLLQQRADSILTTLLKRYTLTCSLLLQ